MNHAITPHDVLIEELEDVEETDALIVVSRDKQGQLRICGSQRYTSDRIGLLRLAILSMEQDFIVSMNGKANDAD